ncbi:HDIG domain-containing protein (plasmid) [Pontibacillus sp. ALD_SL1]|uniref:HD family phosphohydrolase n=1 Tax=Pontibacillus sp. ALD_SL1 TaxID=2777185 RepID=UPI001A970465|nr:HDIG domain-containing metalloprotein [Pontibacillus sp. ALD_SL1]QST02373.1 HDIG domain-containing protein [Pontibacillus sp. ALD_SL1]
MFKLRYISLLLFFVFVSAFVSQPTSMFEEEISLGEVSDKTIFAPRSVTYVDKEATEQLKQEKLSSIKDIYSMDETVSETIIQDFDQFIKELILAKENLAKSNSEEEKKPSKNEIISNLHNPYNLSEEEVNKFLSLTIGELEKMNDIFQKELELIFESGITEGNVESVRKNFQELKNNTNFYLFFSKEIIETLSHHLSNQITPNFILDEEATNKKKLDELASVGDVVIEIKKREAIVNIGDRVNEIQIKKLEELGIINQSYNYEEAFMQLPLFILFFGLFYIYGFTFKKEAFSKMRTFLFIFSSMSVVIVLTNVIPESFLNFSLFLPLLTILMIFTVFWGRSFIIVASIVLGALVSPGDLDYLLVSVTSGFLLAVGFKPNSKRINILFSGVILGIVLGLSELGISYALSAAIHIDTSISLLACSFIAAVLTVGLIPLVENSLGLVTSVRLYELSDPNHKLLKNLMKHALGTYTHSIMVGNLAEMAAEEIGANGLLLKIGAYFHDVGKLKNPHYFIENTTPDNNPHDLLDPYESAQIIRRHPLDSIEMCRKYNLPEPIIRLIASHHGDSYLNHFYERAKESNPETNKEDFRYQTPTPSSKEEGILLLADSTEAYARFLSSSDIDRDDFARRIESNILEKVEEGILRNCSLSLHDLDKITKVFVNYLVNSNHERISYK